MAPERFHWDENSTIEWCNFRHNLFRGTGKASGEYEDFVTGFVTPETKVWGRPVGITVAKDGDKSIWHVSYSR